jgi:hypothetical protein
MTKCGENDAEQDVMIVKVMSVIGTKLGVQARSMI